MMSPAFILTSAVWPVDAGELLEHNDLQNRKNMKVGDVQCIKVVWTMSPAVILTSVVWPVDAGELMQYNNSPDFVMCQSCLSDVSSRYFDFCGLAS